jgi:NTP pyrophosphatase (non-canonical NTP hydrolase)
MNHDEIRSRWCTAIAGREDSLARAQQLLGDLLMLMADLRGPAGCPWDREQSLASLRQYVREEADEVCADIDALLQYEDGLRLRQGLPLSDPAPPDGDERARTDKKGHSIAHHPHHADFDPAASASGAPLPVLDATTAAERDRLYAALAGELGDLLLQAAFMGDILQGMGRGGVDDFAARIIEKLVRRHPHVYGDVQAADSAAVLANWERIKQRERGE